jgi:hypothetical protein
MRDDQVTSMNQAFPILDTCRRRHSTLAASLGSRPRRSAPGAGTRYSRAGTVVAQRPAASGPRVALQPTVVYNAKPAKHSRQEERHEARAGAHPLSPRAPRQTPALPLPDARSYSSSRHPWLQSSRPGQAIARRSEAERESRRQGRESESERCVREQAWRLSRERLRDVQTGTEMETGRSRSS